MEKLQEWLEEEEKDDGISIKPLHPHYRELCRIILKNCSDTMKDAVQIGQAVEDIWNVRKAKLKSSIEGIEKSRSETEIPPNGGMFNISTYTQLEINYIRTMFIESLNNTFVISKRTTELEQRTDQDETSIMT